MRLGGVSLPNKAYIKGEEDKASEMPAQRILRVKICWIFAPSTKSVCYEQRQCKWDKNE